MTTSPITLASLPRAPKETKKEGYIPAVYYGAHAVSTPIFINSIEFQKVLRLAGESTLISLTTGDVTQSVMVQDVQLHPVKHIPMHVDFYVVEKGQKVDVKVPIVFVGQSQAVHDGGILVKVMHELNLEGEAVYLPHEISVDISALSRKDSVIKVRDIVLPQGVVLYHVNPDEIVVSISEAKEETEVPTEVDLSTIEVEEKGKKEEEAEE